MYDRQDKTVTGIQAENSLQLFLSDKDGNKEAAFYKKYPYKPLAIFDSDKSLVIMPCNPPSVAWAKKAIFEGKFEEEPEDEDLDLGDGCICGETKDELKKTGMIKLPVCGHEICLKCAMKMEIAAKETSDKIKCPFCRNQFELAPLPHLCKAVTFQFKLDPVMYDILSSAKRPGAIPNQTEEAYMRRCPKLSMTVFFENVHSNCNNFMYKFTAKSIRLNGNYDSDDDETGFCPVTDWLVLSRDEQVVHSCLWNIKDVIDETQLYGHEQGCICSRCSAIENPVVRIKFMISRDEHGKVSIKILDDVWFCEIKHNAFEEIQFRTSN